MKFLKILLAIVVMISIGYSAAPSAYTVAGMPEGGFDRDYDISTAAAWDTSVSADTITLLTNFNPEQGYEYYLVRDAITGTGSDSVGLQVRVDVLTDKDGDLLYSVLVDTMVAAPGEAIDLKIRQTALGGWFNVYLFGISANGAQVILHRLMIYKRRGIVTDKNWR